MLVLIWSKDKTIKEEVVKAYFQLFFDPKEYDSFQISSNIISLLNESNLTEATSLEELLSFMIDWNNQIEEKDKEKKRDLYQISPNVYKNLWETFTKGLNEPFPNKKEMRAALQILRICFSKNKEALVQKFDGFVNILSSSQKKRSIDWIIVKEFALILEKSADNHSKLTKTLVKILIDSHGTADTEWFCAAEQIINMIFSFKADPETLSKGILLKCTAFLYEKKAAEPQNNLINNNDDDNNNNNQNPTITQLTPEKLTQTQFGFETLIPAEKEVNEMINEDEEKDKGLEFEMKLAQLLFVVGHIAIKYLIYIDNYENELKKLKNEAETKYQANQKDNNTEDLEKIHGGLEAEYEKKIEMLHQISEQHLFQKNLLGSYIPIIKKICQDILDGLRVNVNPILDRAVLMTLCKFMCVSGQFCKENLDMLFKLMNSNIDPTIKNNIIISLGKTIILIFFI